MSSADSAAAASVSADAAAAPQSSNDSSKNDSNKQQQQSNKKNNKKNKKKNNKNGGNKRVEKKEDPEFVKYREAIWDRIEAAQEAARQAGGDQPIKITLPDGKVVDGVAGVTTPLDVAKSISDGLARNTCVAKVNGQVQDAFRPIMSDATLELCGFDTPEGKHTFWHSSAHILGRAMELEFACRLCIGPPVDEGGFYYDAEMGDRKVTQDDYRALESHIKATVKGKYPFKRLELRKEDALEMFKYNKYKVEIINKKVPDGETCTAYRCGPLIDLCKGPHVPNTGVIKAMEVTKNSAAYWLGKAENDSLQRVYGISFPDKKKLKEYKNLLAEAAKRDHRKLGAEQSLFFFHELSPGSCFFLPHGTRIYNKLVSFIRGEYVKRGYQEVVTPNVYNVDLWKTSGHYANYKENMFMFQCEKQEFGVKPMNCPGHCVMYKHSLHSYRELPLRYADFGVLHRNEMSGALTGLTRVRRFQQDDAHIFCMPKQIKDEVAGVLDMLRHVYGIFGFKYSLMLSTRPEKYLGEIETWDRAEAALKDALDSFGEPWDYNPGDGAFYGPKIDIQLHDALKRKHQCATIQLDFQLPQRFDLQYEAGDESEASSNGDAAADAAGADANADADESESKQKEVPRPVMIHRAILGSVERMIAVLIEHTGGKWPLWLSPRQVKVVPIAPAFKDYAESVQKRFFEAGFYADADLSRAQFKKKVRNAQIEQYNYILVVGKNEEANGTVNIRTRDNKVHGEKKVADVIEQLLQEVAEYK